MNITLTVKQLGKKIPLLNHNNIEIDYDKEIITLENLLNLIVSYELRIYINKKNDELMNVFYNHQKYEKLKGNGDNIPNLFEAQSSVKNAFHDGLFVVFYGDQQLLDLTQEIDLNTQKILTFVRLTFLVSGYF
jgi:hypothetical protein